MREALPDVFGLREAKEAIEEIMETGTSYVNMMRVTRKRVQLSLKQKQ